ncbi:MAG: bifunctional 3-(3-hydroxy-phenyl)propionate/3-hydroxycinnamic acid hydroxylase [Bacteroidota bacterium]
MEEHFQVIIIGFGPTGATLGSLLGQAGISTLVLDRESHSCTLPRAVHFDGEVMRVFQSIGVSEELRHHTIVNAGMQFLNKTNGHLLLDWPRPQTIGPMGWHPSYRFHQPDLEAVLHKNLDRFSSVLVRKGCEVQEIYEQEHPVRIRYEELETGEHHEASAAYLVGCDGARSITRKQICQPPDETIEDFQYNQDWLVVDVILNQLKPDLSEYTLQYCHPQNPVTAAKGPGLRRRWEFALGDSGKKKYTEKEVWQLLSPWVSRNEAVMERYAVYQFHATLALKWRKNRLLIAGDAAHQTPPFMGQGMCAGIRDASNLAWKLILCLQDRHKEYVLDTYGSERMTHVRTYIQTAIRLGELVNSSSEADLLEKLNSPNGKMKSIQPTLGNGLSTQENGLAGSIFPQASLMKPDGSSILMDDVCGYAPVLLIHEAFLESLSLEERTFLTRSDQQGLQLFSTASTPSLLHILEELKVKAVLIRPDRYVLASAQTEAEFRMLCDHLPNVLPTRESVRQENEEIR